MYKTYVMHYKPATDRYYFMCNQLQENQIKNYEFVIDYDQQDLTQELICRYYDNGVNIQHDSSKFSTRNESPIDYRKLKTSEISLCIKYIKTFEAIMSRNDDYILFLEDDCCFKTKDISIEEIIKKAPNNWDVIFIGGAFDINIVKVIDVFAGYALADHPATNTSSSFIMNKKSIEKIIHFTSPFCLPLDWQLNYAFKKANLNVYHTLPYLCGQLSGSEFESIIKH